MQNAGKMQRRFCSSSVQLPSRIFIYQPYFPHHPPYNFIARPVYPLSIPVSIVFYLSSLTQNHNSINPILGDSEESFTEILCKHNKAHPLNIYRQTAREQLIF